MALENGNAAGGTCVEEGASYRTKLVSCSTRDLALPKKPSRLVVSGLYFYDNCIIV